MRNPNESLHSIVQERASAALHGPALSHKKEPGRGSGDLMRHKNGNGCTQTRSVGDFDVLLVGNAFEDGILVNDVLGEIRAGQNRDVEAVIG